MITREDWLSGETTSGEERALFDTGVISRCEFEFGPHEDHSDCDRILDAMSGSDDEDYTFQDYPAYDPQTDHFNQFGRPAFPNEY